MKNSDYWAQRFLQLEKSLHRMGEIGVSDIERQYREAQKQIDADIARWYQRLADNNGISLAEARKFLQGSDLKEFKWDVWEYIKYGEENALDGKWMKELENASAKFHISRLEALRIQTQQSLEVMFAKQMGTVRDTVAKVFESSYYHTAFEIQKGFGVGWDIAGLNQYQIEKLISKPWAMDGYNFSERIWSSKEKLINEIHGVLTQNIMLGQDPQKAIDAIANKMNTSKYNAGRLVMTEEAAFAAKAQQECYKELDVEKYEIVETFDAIACDTCRAMDGKVFPMSEYQVGLTVPPFHPNCRGCTAPAFDEDFGEVGERAARDIKTMKTYNVPADMSYEEWKKNFVDVDKSVQNDIIETYKGKVPVFGTNAIKDETVEKVSNAAKTVLSDFKTLEHQIDSISFDEISDNLGINIYSPSTGRDVINLSASAFSDETSLLEQLRSDYKAHKSYQTEHIESLVAHEMGHAAHVALALKRAGLEYGKPLSPIELYSFEAECDKIAQEVYLTAFTNEDFWEIQDLCATELGDMCRENAHELIAQSFGNYYYGSNKSKIAQIIVKFFKKRLK